MSGSKTSGWKQLDTGGRRHSQLHSAHLTADFYSSAQSEIGSVLNGQHTVNMLDSNFEHKFSGKTFARYWCTGLRDSQQQMFINVGRN